MLKKTLFFLAFLFCIGFSISANAQVIFPLGDGKELTVKGKLVGTNTSFGKEYYLEETPEMLYIHEYDTRQRTAIEVHIPIRSLQKEFAKKYDAQIRLYKIVTNHVVNIRAGRTTSLSKNPNEYAKYYHGYTQAPAMDKLHISIDVYFDKESEAKAFVKRTQDSLKKIK